MQNYTKLLNSTSVFHLSEEYPDQRGEQDVLEGNWRFSFRYMENKLKIKKINNKIIQKIEILVVNALEEKYMQKQNQVCGGVCAPKRSDIRRIQARGQRFVGFVVGLTAIVGLPADALGGGNGVFRSGTSMWGVSGTMSSSSSLLASATMHVSNGISAGHVNAAREGMLFAGSSVSISSIGSQSIIATTIYGNRNDVDVNADQQSTNSGEVSNNATLNYTKVKNQSVESD